MHRILDLLRQLSELVVIDSPPALAVTDAMVLSPHVDGVILVVSPSVTKIPPLTQSIDQLRQVGANILEVVLNNVEVKRGGYRYCYYKAYQHAYENRYTKNPKEPTKSRRSWMSFFKG